MKIKKIIFFSFLLIVFFLFRIINSKQKTIQVKEEPEIVIKKEYGIVVNNYDFQKLKIQSGETFSDIFDRYRISPIMVDKIQRYIVNNDIFDFRNIRAGNNYAVFSTKDSLSRGEIFIYEINYVDYILFDFRDSLNISLMQKEVETKNKYCSGVVETSLWASIVDSSNLSPALLMKMSEIYAWTIDFFRLEKGDKYKIFFEEKFVEGESIGVGKVMAALYQHKGNQFYAFNFQINENYDDYFDQNGKSLRRAFLRAPLSYSYRISSKFQKRRLHPVTGKIKPHLGTDYAAPQGTPIIATANGKVIKSSYTKNNGYYVKIRHNSTYTTQYLHMLKRGRASEGSYVKQGDVIGYVGQTGLATGPHVCYRFWKNGRQVDPYKQKLPEAEPISKDYIDDFKIIADSLYNILDKI
ncbi:MAG: peptidase M23 [Flavobacteriales bacterium]|nr:peptidase M23 [Flavobacteriales bacterium]